MSETSANPSNNKAVDQSTIDEGIKVPPTEQLSRAITRFLRRIQGIKQADEIVMPVIAKMSIEADEALEVFLEGEGVKKLTTEKGTTYSFPPNKSSEFDRVYGKVDSLNSALFQTPRALLVALVSCFDAYLGELLRSLFYLKPELLNSSGRSLTFSELVNMGSIERAREYLVEKEVESVIRESHSKHFDWMENRFGVALRKGLDCWPVFIELTERRNLFVHTDGVISTQYMEVCNSHGVSIGKRVPGMRLGVSPSYFANAFSCLFEIGVKLAHVLWRKLAPDDLEQADQALINTTFRLLTEKKYAIARRLLEFATSTIKKHFSNYTRRVFIVNLAISLRGQNDKPASHAIINAEDWSDCGDNFKLAAAVVRENYEEASQLMLVMGRPAKGIEREGYEHWPLFDDFRTSDQFLKAFKEVYGEEFRRTEIKAAPPESAAVEILPGDPSRSSAPEPSRPLGSAEEQNPETAATRLD